MAEVTTISWAHATFNPWIGCTKVSPGCDHCYAERDWDHRYGRVKWGPGEARSRTKTWGEPRRWNRLAAASGKPWRVFCASLADVFDNEAPEAWRTDLWALIEDTPALTWMLLTKRIGRWAGSVPDRWLDQFPPNVWLGITVVNQEEADRDIPKLLKVPARVRWLSMEPLLGPVDLRDPPNDIGEPRYSYLDEDLDARIGWAIVGGESGRGARPMDPAWARSIRDQCAYHGVPFHFKQWGGLLRPTETGHRLDGVVHRAFPGIET